MDEISEVAAIVPSLELADQLAGGTIMNFRGINWSGFTFKLPVIMYLDGVPYDETYYFDGDFDNIERIEVLRGAQGTLYGQNAMAGVINVISKTPGNQAEGKATVKLGEHENY